MHHQKVDQIYTYRLRDEDQEKACVGMICRVHFGNSRFLQEGFIVDLSEEAEIPEEKIKPVEALLSSEPLFSDVDLAIARWMQKTYMAPLSSCLSLMLPKQWKINEKPVYLIRPLTGREESLKGHLGKSQKAFLESLFELCSEERGVLLDQVLEKAPLTKASMASLIARGTIALEEVETDLPITEETVRTVLEKTKETFLELNEDQTEAKEAIEASIRHESFQEFLLHGITGSGKTEVYLNAIRCALSIGKDVIVLVPEISLTPQLISIFKRRFPDLVGVTHSRMTDLERSRIWHQARQGKYKIMIGPRSCLFTPFQNLGLVIIDEEHESSYRSDSMAPHYHAREVAERKSQELGCTLVLGSATPSIETYYRAEQGKIRLLTMTQRAVKGAALPISRIIDMRKELEEGNLSMLCRDLVEGIHRRLERKEQTILFLNRKGYSTAVSCRKCGFVLKCPRCYLPYTYHLEKDRLICHHCGKETLLPKLCPACGSRYLKQFGTGTEKIEEAVKDLFKAANVVRMDMGTMKSRDDYEKVYRSFADGDGDILIGTQMVAKGFDFPRVTLVGVLAADMTLMEADFHGVERTFQLLTQVSGRAGRSDKQGEVLIQTYSPDHYAIQSARKQDYLAFYMDEIKMRRAMECPPFTHIGQMAFFGKDEEEVTGEARRMAQIMRDLTKTRPFEILGPSPARLVRINNTFRYKILVKCKEEERLRAFLTYCFGKERNPSSRVLVTVDLDPSSIL